MSQTEVFSTSKPLPHANNIAYLYQKLYNILATHIYWFFTEQKKVLHPESFRMRSGNGIDWLFSYLAYNM